MKNWVSYKVIDFCYVADFVANGSFASLKEKVKYVNTPNHAVLVRLTDFTKKWSKDFVYVSKESYEFLKKSSLVPNDLIMSNVGEPGIVFLVPDLKQPMTLGPNSILIRPNEKLSTSKFLYFYFLSEIGKKQIDIITTGAAQKKFNKTSFRDLKIVLPNLSEQLKITSILSQTFSAITTVKDNMEQNKRNAQELFDSYLQQLFEAKGHLWKEQFLEDVVDKNCKLSYGIVQPGDECVNGLPIVRPTDLNSRYITTKGLKRINPVLADGYKRTSLMGDELLLCVRGNTGLISSATQELKGGNVTRGIVPIRFNSKIINQEYGYYLLTSRYIQGQIKAKTYGAALMQINIADLRKISVLYPPIFEQQSIVKKLNALRTQTQELEANYQKNVADLDELKKSILIKAFTGELTMNAFVESNSPISFNISTTDLHASIIALALQKHEQSNAMGTFHHVKTEKIVHMIESHLGIELGRVPIKDAAGPNDYPLKMKVESRARKAGYFYVQQSNNIKNYTRGSKFDSLITKANGILGEHLKKINEMIDLMVPMTTQQAEIMATVYAAWNNLLLDGVKITDEAIVTEAREKWHPNKLNIPRDKFFKAIGWMKEKSLVPKGTGKRVIEKPN